MIAADELAARGVKRNRADPASMPFERQASAIGKREALDRVILRAGEDEAAGRVEAARDKRAVVPQLLHEARAGRVDAPAIQRLPRRQEAHASTSVIESACGSAIGIGRP